MSTVMSPECLLNFGNNVLDSCGVRVAKPVAFRKSDGALRRVRKPNISTLPG